MQGDVAASRNTRERPLKLGSLSVGQAVGLYHIFSHTEVQSSPQEAVVHVRAWRVRVCVRVCVLCVCVCCCGWPQW